MHFSQIIHFVLKKVIETGPAYYSLTSAGTQKLNVRLIAFISMCVFVAKMVLLHCTRIESISRLSNLNEAKL